MEPHLFSYLEPLYRPPSEGNSLIFQVAFGCPNNTCAFCGMYKNRKYNPKPMQEVLAEIRAAGKAYPETQRVFLADGDMMYFPFEDLETILTEINRCFPRLIRVGSYANGSSLLKKTREQLCRLKALKLGICYLGLESGSDAILQDMKKYEPVQDMVKAVNLAQDCGIKMSVMVLLGLGGPGRSLEHARATAEAVNAMQPVYLSALTVYPKEGTVLARWVEKGEFQLLNAGEVLLELKELISHLELRGTVFRCNHASNPFPMGGRFPKDKQKLMQEIDFLLEETPEEYRWQQRL